jgi:predicted MFS family arabinose efflux permease
MSGVVFLMSFGRVAFAPLLETFRTAFGVGPAALGLLTSLVWIGTAASRIPAGVVLTRVRRERVVRWTGLVLAVGAVAAATAPSLRVLQAAAFVIGCASGAYLVASVPLLGDLYPEATGRVLGLHGTAAALAAVAAPAVVLAVLDLATWRAAFWLVAAGALVVTLAFALQSRGGIDASVPPDRDFLAALRHWRVLVLGIVLVAGAGFVWQGLFNFYVSYMLEKGLSRGTANVLLSVVFGAGVPAFLVSGRLVDRLPAVPYVLGILGAFSACVLGLTATAWLPAVVVLSVLVGFVIHGLFPAIDAFMLGRLPDGDRASAYAVFSGLALLLEATGSGVVGALTGAGWRFDEVFRAFGLGLAALVVVLVAARLSGRLS